MNRFLLLICSLSLLCACSELFPQDEDLKQPNTEEPQPEEEEPYLDPDTHYLSVHIDNGVYLSTTMSPGVQVDPKSIDTK